MHVILPLHLPDTPETEAQREIRLFREQVEAIRRARRHARLMALLQFILSRIRKGAAASAAAPGDARSAAQKLCPQPPQI